MTGTKKSLMRPEKRRPEIMAPPSPRHSGLVIVIGIRPRILVSDVNKIGSSRLPDASTTASCKFIPCFRLSFIFSTTTIALVTTIPNKASTPIRAGKERGVPVNANI